MTAGVGDVDCQRYKKTFMTDVRLQKFLAECGVGSRRKMEQFIKEGRVRVNGQVVTELGRKVNPDSDKVEVNRRPVHAAPKGILLLNKPRGVVSTLSDPEGRRSVADYLTKHYQSYFPVGRLDWDSTGLMVLTNDGEMAERLMHPRYEFERVYHARVEGSVSMDLLAKLGRGIRLSDGMVKAEALVLKNDENSTWVEIKIREGRNRVVRRLFDKLGHPVMKLKRMVYGPFKLGRLQVGQMRVLTRKEYEEARQKVLRVKPGGEELADQNRPRQREDDRSSQTVRDDRNVGDSKRARKPSGRSGWSSQLGRSDNRDKGRTSGPREKFGSRKKRPSRRGDK